MNEERINKKSEAIKKTYEVVKKSETQMPIKEYLRFILLKKEYKLPLTAHQKEFLETASA